MHQNKIIDVTTIETHAQIVFDIMVKGIQIKISEHLTCEIANRQPTVGSAIKKALVFRKVLPVASFSLDKTIACWLIFNDFSGYLQD